jgi:hypothetical protein
MKNLNFFGFLASLSHRELSSQWKFLSNVQNNVKRKRVKNRNNNGLNLNSKLKYFLRSLFWETYSRIDVVVWQILHGCFLLSVTL